MLEIVKTILSKWTAWRTARAERRERARAAARIGAEIARVQRHIAKAREAHGSTRASYNRLRALMTTKLRMELNP